MKIIIVCENRIIGQRLAAIFQETRGNDCRAVSQN